MTFQEFINVAKVVMSFEIMVAFTAYVWTAAACIARNNHDQDSQP